MTRILLVGGGGHCKSVLDSVIGTEQYSEIVIIDKKENVGSDVLGKLIVATDKDLMNYFKMGYKKAFVTVGSIGVVESRIKLFNTLEKIGYEIPNIIDKTASVSKFSSLDKGIYIGKNTVVNASSTIKRGAIINTNSIIEHDCIIEEFTHIAPGTVICGQVKIGENSHIGAGSVIKQGTNIGENVLIGMGSVVLNDIGNNQIAFGNPCKVVREK